MSEANDLSIDDLAFCGKESNLWSFDEKFLFIII